MTSHGAELSGPPTQAGWGTLASIKLPSGADLPIYQPRHPTAHDLES